MNPITINAFVDEMQKIATSTATKANRYFFRDGMAQKEGPPQPQNSMTPDNRSSIYYTANGGSSDVISTARGVPPAGNASN